jgi:hypothetical protein
MFQGGFVFLEVKIMTDNQIEKLILKEIRKRKVSLQDMIGGEFIYPDSDDKTNLNNQDYRRNRFKETFSEQRMKELLCVGEYNELNNMPLLKVDFQDLFRFWWNRCISKELFADEVLGEIFDYFADQMKPVDASNQMDLSINFKQLDLTWNDKDKAA